MSVKDYNHKIIVKGDSTPTPVTFNTRNDVTVMVSLPLYEVSMLLQIREFLKNESGCNVWYSYMKD